MSQVNFINFLFSWEFLSALVLVPEKYAFTVANGLLNSSFKLQRSEIAKR